MVMPKYGAKRDMNEMPIVNGLRAIGAKVKRMSEDDLLVGWRRRNFILEVKTDKGKLTEQQEEMIRGWPGQYEIVRNLDEALVAIGATSETNFPSEYDEC